MKSIDTDPFDFGRIKVFADNYLVNGNNWTKNSKLHFLLTEIADFEQSQETSYIGR